MYAAKVSGRDRVMRASSPGAAGSIITLPPRRQRRPAPAERAGLRF
jgi:hypothetical protein